jgi:hypothetical protein
VDSWVTQSACARKRAGQLSILGKRSARKVADIAAPQDPRDMAKATLLEIQSPGVNADPPLQRLLAVTTCAVIDRLDCRNSAGCTSEQ